MKDYPSLIQNNNIITIIIIMIIIIILINVFIHHKIKATYLMLHNYHPNKI